MPGAHVIRLEDTETIPLGIGSTYRPIVGNDAGSTPVRTGIQTCEPGYEVPPHCHPYVEIIHMLEGALEFWVDGFEFESMRLNPGDTVEIQPGTWHAFRTHGDATARLLGTHTSPTRIVSYKPGVRVDARGYRISET